LIHQTAAVRLAGCAVLALLMLGAVGWGALAIYFSGPGSPTARAGLALGFALACAALGLLARPRRWGLLGGLVLVALVLGWWVRIPPVNDRDWQPDVAQLAWTETQGDTVTVHNVRNNEYRSETDYTLRYEDRRFDLSGLRTLDLFMSYWGSPSIAHTVVSYGFADGRYLAFSIETRKEKGEDYSAVKGFFKQYELIIVVADERDVIRLRTNYRGEDVYLYRLRTGPAVIRTSFVNYVRAVNRLRREPEWYNALTHNCTTTIRGLAPPGTVRRVPHWKVLLNGHLDELLYERGILDRSQPFADLRAASWINDRAKSAGAAAFSQQIRQGLPGGPDRV
jgi:Domain of unknown function (DUF4105)